MPPASPRLALNDGRTMPQLGFGMWRVPAEIAADTVSTALGLGYRLIDGAALYGNEEGLGEGLRRSGVPRDEVFVTSKIWNDAHGYDAALRAFDAILARLRIEHLDLLLIHWPVPSADLYAETWRALIRLRDEGRTRSIGVSNFHRPHLDRLARDSEVVPAVNQIELHPRLQQPAMRAYNTAHGIVTQSWSPLGQMKSFDAPEIAKIAARLGRSPAQVILRWHLELGLSVIPRSTREKGLRENMTIDDFALTPEDVAAIGGLDQGERTGPDPDTRF